MKFLSIKKITILLGALLLSLLLVECGIRSRVVAVPYYKASHIYRSIDDPRVTIKETPPGYEWINGESGEFIKNNEYGLPGITYRNQPQKVALCGSSFVMGQLKQSDIASSVLQKALVKRRAGIGVYNLGAGNHGPYLSYHRACFYDGLYSFDRVVLINDGNWEPQASRAIQFVDSGKGYFQIGPSRNQRLLQLIRSKSMFINLLAIVLNAKYGEGYTAALDNATYPTSYELPGYQRTLQLYARKWGKGFFVVDISGDIQFSLSLKRICDNMEVPYFRKNLIHPEYLIGGKGHLNKQGNASLGVFLDQVMQRLDI